MPWKLNDLELGASSAVETVQDGPVDVAVALALTPQERREVEELCEHAGRLQEVQVPLTGLLVVDTSPRGENTVLLTPNADAGQVAGDLVDPGWFAVADCADDWRGSTTVNRLQLALKRITGVDGVEGITSTTTEFLEHDF